MNAIKDVMMNKVLAGEAGKEKAREWGWLRMKGRRILLRKWMPISLRKEKIWMMVSVKNPVKGYSAICKRKFREDVLPD
mgnify:CR=1 FL=1